MPGIPTFQSKYISMIIIEGILGHFEEEEERNQNPRKDPRRMLKKWSYSAISAINKGWKQPLGLNINRYESSMASTEKQPEHTEPGAGAGAADGEQVLQKRGSSNYNDRDSFSSSRLIPSLSTFYSQNPPHEQNMNELRYMTNKYIKLPKQELHLVERKQWVSRGQYGLNGGGTRLKSKEYDELLKGLKSLNEIHPQFKNDELLKFLNRFIRKSNILESPKKQNTLDHLGRAISRGTRKTSTSKVYLVKGDGKILVNNNRSLNEYFVKMKDRESVIYPLKIVQQLQNFNCYITTSGGGVTGQAEATMHAIAKSLLVFNPLWKTRLFKAGVLTKDYRHVERKKPGKIKARKAPTWVKR